MGDNFDQWGRGCAMDSFILLFLFSWHAQPLITRSPHLTITDSQSSISILTWFMEPNFMLTMPCSLLLHLVNNSRFIVLKREHSECNFLSSSPLLPIVTFNPFAPWLHRGKRLHSCLLVCSVCWSICTCIPEWIALKKPEHITFCPGTINKHKGNLKHWLLKWRGSGVQRHNPCCSWWITWEVVKRKQEHRCYFSSKFSRT